MTSKWKNVVLQPEFCSCEKGCQQDYQNSDVDNELQNANCGSTKKLIPSMQPHIANRKHCARASMQTNSTKQIYISFEINVIYLTKLFIMLTINMLHCKQFHPISSKSF